MSQLRYRLRTLLILLGLGPAVLAGAWFWVKPIAEDYWVLRYGDDAEVIERYVVVVSGAGDPPEPRGFHPIAEFFNRTLP